MGDWDRLYSACKDATGKEIEDIFDASQIVEELNGKCQDLEKKDSIIYNSIINNLSNLKRYNVSLYESIKGNSTFETKEVHGKYVKWEDIHKLITEICASNNL